MTHNASVAEEDLVAELSRRARALRLHVLRQARGRGEGYFGQGLQCADLFAVLFFSELNWSPDRLTDPDRDRFLMSVGHYAIILYAALAETGVIAVEQLDSYGADGSALSLGAEPGEVPGIEFAGGSLGQGLGVAAGLAWGLRRQGRSARVFNYMSDGEVQEGAVWEAAMFAGHTHLDNLVNIVDVNRTQADGDLVLEIEPVRAEYEAFGWWVTEVDGHDLAGIVDAFARARSVTDRPTCLVAHTQIGQGSPTAASRERAHFIRIRPDAWDQIEKELSAMETIE
jgi:transketolase